MTLLVALTRIVVRVLYSIVFGVRQEERNVDRTYCNSAAFQNMKGFYWLLILLLLSVGEIESVQAAPASPSGAEPRFPKPTEVHSDPASVTLEYRAEERD